MRTVLRILTAAVLIAAPLLAASEAPAGAQTGSPTASSHPGHAASHSLTIAIDSMSPNWAGPKTRITVRGTVTNNTGSPVRGLQVAMQTSTTPFLYRSDMESYVSGSAGSSAVTATNPVGTPYPLPGVFHTGTTADWSVSFPASAVGYPSFGVYPLAAVLEDSSYSPMATDPTLLPYWPGSGANPVQTSWIWPLMDQPQQGPCAQGLVSNSLASSLKPSGRLGGLLNAGLSPAAAGAGITWAVDPALLANAQTMTAPYKTGGTAGCPGTAGDPVSEPASTDAAQWLSNLKTNANAIGQPLFVTPYADADTTAMAHAGLLPSMKSAYTAGDQLAGRLLARPGLEAPDSGTGDGGAPSAAWLAGGPTDTGVLSALQETGQVNTAILGTSSEPSMASTVNQVPVRHGGKMRLLLADSQLSSVLGSSSAASSPGSQFATEQDFLAETAQLVADLPFAAQPIVIAPPRQWDPSVTEARALLSESTHAPWLKPVPLSKVTSSPAVPRVLPSYVYNSSQLSTTYMNFVKAVQAGLGNYQPLLSNPGPDVTQALQAAMTSAASSAWRDAGGGTGTENLFNLASYISASEKKVQIIAGDRYLFTGASGYIAVSVHNGTSQAISVRVEAKPHDAGQLSVGKFDALPPVAAGKTGTVKIPVQATGIETTTLQLQLVTANGIPLPQTQRTATVQVTRYGQALFILIGAALGVAVLASGMRWLRRRRNGTTAESGGTG